MTHTKLLDRNLQGPRHTLCQLSQGCLAGMDILRNGSRKGGGSPRPQCEAPMTTVIRPWLC